MSANRPGRAAVCPIPSWPPIPARRLSAVKLADIIVLQCAQPAIFEAIVGSPKLRRFLRGKLAPDLVVVGQAQLEALWEQLRWAGLEVSAELTVKQRQR